VVLIDNKNTLCAKEYKEIHYCVSRSKIIYDISNEGLLYNFVENNVLKLSVKDRFAYFRFTYGGFFHVLPKNWRLKRG